MTQLRSCCPPRTTLQLPALALILLPLLLLLLLLTLPVQSAPDSARLTEYQAWIGQMKAQPRGPFKRLRWYCNDGTIQPPKAYACSERGGGYQHGQWSDRTEKLRADGYYIATLLAGVKPAELTAGQEFLDIWHQMLIEKYLMAADDGWIMRQALFYRGAIQEEDERAGGQLLLTYLSGLSEWQSLRFASLRIGVQNLPHGQDSASAQKVRQLSASLSDRDKTFTPLRAKIHGTPEQSDAQRVRDYAAGVSNRDLNQQYLELADEIDRVYQAPSLSELLQQGKQSLQGEPGALRLLTRATSNQDDFARFILTADLLAGLRDALPGIRQAANRLKLLDLSLAVENESFALASRLRPELENLSRRQLVSLLAAGVEASYGSGLINQRERSALSSSLEQLQASELPLASYRQQLSYLARLPGWGTQWLQFNFGEAASQLTQIEPKAELWIQDQLRGSPLLFYADVLARLQQDADQLAGVSHTLFGQPVRGGLQALNPGLARGTLYTRPDIAQQASLQVDGIYLLPETVATLPPVAGILTQGSGNPLSHIQLLARNLGIPNVSVDTRFSSQLSPYNGKPVVLAVSQAGLVELSADGPQWDERLGERSDQHEQKPSQPTDNVLIRPDLQKLDLSQRALTPLTELRADDSGRIAGPKAAKLGELHHHYPEAVAPGLVLPFGLFKQVVLERPYPPDNSQSVWQWMVAQYRMLDALADDTPGQKKARQQQTEQFRAELYQLILNTPLDEPLRDALRQQLRQLFGADGSYGLFVRSDTNVEDLPGFTGAGLNLTVPNVVGFEALLEAIPRVWASPFTARAFAWRQALMSQPEHVYPAVLLLKTVANDKSGVLVTQDIDSGESGILSVAVNEGVGGAVDGQLAESVRINTRDGSLQLLASATAVWRRVPLANGGLSQQRVSGAQSVLKADEVQQLITLARELPERFPALVDDRGELAPADIEFGFLDGKLQLFQIRPFLESRSGRGRAYLAEMDQALEGAMDKRVVMDDRP